MVHKYTAPTAQPSKSRPDDVFSAGCEKMFGTGRDETNRCALVLRAVEAALGGDTECAGISRPCSTSIRRLPMKRFEPPRFSLSERSPALTNRRRRTNPHLRSQSMKLPGSPCAFSVRLTQAHHPRIGKKNRPRRRRVALAPSVFRSADFGKLHELGRYADEAVLTQTGTDTGARKKIKTGRPAPQADWGAGGGAIHENQILATRAPGVHSAFLTPVRATWAGTGGARDSTVVSLCDLLRQPSIHARKALTVTVRLTSMKEGTSLWSPACSKLGVGLLTDDEARPDSGVRVLRQELEKYNLSARPVIATLTGVYERDYFDEIKHRNRPVFRVVAAKDIKRSRKTEFR